MKLTSKSHPLGGTLHKNWPKEEEEEEEEDKRWRIYIDVGFKRTTRIKEVVVVGKKRRKGNNDMKNNYHLEKKRIRSTGILRKVRENWKNNNVTCTLVKTNRAALETHCV